MSKIIKNKEVLSLLIIILIIVIIILNCNYQKNKCIKNNGKVITDQIGLFDKCIYGDDKE